MSADICPTNECEPVDQCYHCPNCHEWGPCGCGPAVYGCTNAEGCRAAWHVCGCPAENGDCDRPERHTIGGTRPVPPPAGGWPWNPDTQEGGE